MDPNYGLWICRFLALGGAMAVAIGTGGGQYFTSKIEKIRDKKIDELVSGKNELSNQNKELISRVSEYKTELEKYKADSEAKGQKIKQLEIEAKKMSRGISSVYDFNGAKRTTMGSGKMTVIAGEEHGIFLKMQQLIRERNYSELIRISEEQIVKTPEWLTPYLFSGLAYADLGQKEKAIQKLEHIIDKAPSDPAYAQAVDILKRLKEE